MGQFVTNRMTTARWPGSFLSGWMIIGLGFILFSGPAASAQDTAGAQKTPDQPKLGWANATDLSLVMTSGNAESRTLGFANHLKHVWPNAKLELDATAVRSSTTDDRFFRVQPGVDFAVGASPADPLVALVEPELNEGVSTYFVAGRYERNIAARFFWNTGASWDRNEDAGILNRYIAFAGVGHNWVDTEARHFATNYGISFTDREEEEPDPEKEGQFAGARLGWDYREMFGTSSTTFASSLLANINLANASDVSISTTNSVTVKVSDHTSLKVSLQWLFESEPALQTDLDVVAFVDLIDPDGIPSSGDEFYRTLETGGAKIVLGSADARKDKLDTIIKTALVISF